ILLRKLSRPLKWHLDLLEPCTWKLVRTVLRGERGSDASYLPDITLLTFNQEAANHYAQFLYQKIRIGTQDLRIAAIAIANNAILVTRNQRDFSRVPGLQFEDWTIGN
nr:hypothetical protein [Nostoc sp. CHAB 5844]